MLGIKETAQLSGVSVRTLQYYDRIGLLRPDCVTEAGYRKYGSAALARLQEIMFFRELGFELKDIARLTDAPDYDRREALRAHRELLELELERTEALIALVERTLANDDQKIEFKEFSMEKIEKAQEKYRQEVKERWGNTKQYAQSEAKERTRTDTERARMDADAEEIFRGFAALAAMGADPAGAEAQSLTARWQAHITKYYYECTPEILRGLGMMYTADERFKSNLDAHGAGTAQLMSDSIAKM